jgi:hypothetical protein
MFPASSRFFSAHSCLLQNSLHSCVDVLHRQQYTHHLNFSFTRYICVHNATRLLSPSLSTTCFNRTRPSSGVYLLKLFHCVGCAYTHGTKTMLLTGRAENTVQGTYVTPAPAQLGILLSWPHCIWAVFGMLQVDHTTFEWCWYAPSWQQCTWVVFGMLQVDLTTFEWCWYAPSWQQCTWVVFGMLQVDHTTSEWCSVCSKLTALHLNSARSAPSWPHCIWTVFGMLQVDRTALELM